MRAISRAALRRAATTLTSQLHTQTNNSFHPSAPFSSAAQPQCRLGSAPTTTPRSLGAGTTMLFSAAAAAATLGQEAHAKEQDFHSQGDDDVFFNQFEDCSFSNKVKAFLDYFNIPYKVVEDHSISNKEFEEPKYDELSIKCSNGKKVVILTDSTIAKEIEGSEYEEMLILTMKGEKFVISSAIGKKEIKESKYEKVPILTIKGENLEISKDTIIMLFKRLSTLATTSEEKKWLEWVDSHLTPVVALNVSCSAMDTFKSFGYEINGRDLRDLPYMKRMILKYGGPIIMYIVTKALKRKYNITDERVALYQAAETWVDALNDRPFLGGSKPNLADLTVFGLLRLIWCLKPGKEMVKKTQITDWLSRMEQMVGDLLN